MSGSVSVPPADGGALGAPDPESREKAARASLAGFFIPHLVISSAVDKSFRRSLRSGRDDIIYLKGLIFLNFSIIPGITSKTLSISSSVVPRPKVKRIDP